VPASATIEPFIVLPLDIVAERVHTVADALARMTNAEMLNGARRARRLRVRGAASAQGPGRALTRSQARSCLAEALPAGQRGRKAAPRLAQSGDRARHTAPTPGGPAHQSRVA
jgi:hypothetical protein